MLNETLFVIFKHRAPSVQNCKEVNENWTLPITVELFVFFSWCLGLFQSGPTSNLESNRSWRPFSSEDRRQLPLWKAGEDATEASRIWAFAASKATAVRKPLHGLKGHFNTLKAIIKKATRGLDLWVRLDARRLRLKTAMEEKEFRTTCNWFNINSIKHWILDACPAEV